MAWQLIYTSAPRLLDAGRSGFGTIARHRDIPSLLVQAVERVSQFARLPGMNPERVIYSHRVIQISSSRYHVLSVIRSAGSDYTGRTNHIAHHLIATHREATDCAAIGLTPGDVLLNYSWLPGWTEPPRSLEAADEVRLADVPPYPLHHSVWAPLTGSPDHAWLLITHPAGRSCYVKAPVGTDFRLVFLESLRGMAGSAWQAAFTTSAEPTDDAGDFRWIAIEGDSPSAATAENSGRIILDLTRPATLPEPDVQQQAALSSPTITPPSVRPPTEVGASASQRAAPFVEREALPPAKGRGLSPRDQPAGTKDTHARSQKSNNHLLIITGALAALVLVFGLVNNNRKQVEQKKAGAQNSADEQEVLQAKAVRLKKIKDLLGDPYFDENTIDSIDSANVGVEEKNRYCERAKKIAKAYLNADFKSPPEGPTNPAFSAPKVEKLQAQRVALNKLIEKPFQEVNSDPLKLADTRTQQIKTRLDEVENAIKLFRNTVNNDAMQKTMLSDDWRPNQNETKKRVLESSRKLFTDALRHKLRALADSPSLPAEAGKQWRNAIERAKIDDPDLLQIVSRMERLGNDSSSHVIAKAGMPQTPAADNPSSPASLGATIPSNATRIEYSRPPEAQAIAAASKIIYHLYDTISAIEVPIDVPLTRESKVRYRSSPNADFEELTYREGWQDFGKGENKESWFKLNEKKDKLIAAEAAKSNAAKIFEMNVTGVSIHFFVINGPDMHTDKDDPLIQLDPAPELTLGKDRILRGELLGRIKLKATSLSLGLKFTGLLGDKIDRLHRKALLIDQDNKLDVEPLAKVKNSIGLTTMPNSSQAVRDLQTGIENDKEEIKQLETKLAGKKAPDHTELRKTLDRIKTGLPRKEIKLQELLNSQPAEGISNELHDAAIAIKNVLFDSTNDPRAGFEKSPAVLRLLLMKPSESSASALAICNVIINFK